MPPQKATASSAEGAVLYIRQSITRRRRDKDGNYTSELDTISPELQEASLRAYCEQRGYHIVAVIIDLNRTGRTLKRRSVQEAVDYIRRGEATVIAVWKWSRLARKRQDFVVACDTVESLGGRVECSTEPVDTSTASGRLQRGMLAEFAAFFSDQLGEDWRGIIAHHVKQGLPPNAKPRFGYVRTEHLRFTPDPDLGEVLATMYRRYIAGDGLITIARWLNDHGYRTVEGGRWREGRVRQVLDSGFGAGKILYHGQYRDGVHTPVITPQEWDQYLAARAARKTVPSRAKSSRYLLTGLVKCALCRGAMNARTDTRGVPWYVCKNRFVDGCPNGYVRVADVDAVVYDWLRTISSDVDQAASVARKRQARVTVKRRNADTIARQLRDQDEALVRLTVDRARGLVPEDAYTLARDEIQAVRDKLAAELEEVSREAGTVARIDPTEYRGLLEEWDTLPVASRREGLRRLLRRVTVSTDPRTVVPVPVWEDDEPTPTNPPRRRRSRPSYSRPSLTDDQVREIRTKRAEGASYEVLAAEYKISTSTVWNLIKGNTYRHVT